MMMQKKNQRASKRGGSGRAHQLRQLSSPNGSPCGSPRTQFSPQFPSAANQPEPKLEQVAFEEVKKPETAAPSTTNKDDKWLDAIIHASSLDNLVTNETADAFNKRFPFPACMTTSLKGLTHFMFLHSLLFTFMTPLVRYLDGIWKEVVPTYWMWDQLDRFVFGGPGIKYSFTYHGTEKPHVDRAFILHAVAGIVWLVCGWLQIAVVSKKYHARFAWVSLAALIVHLGYSMHILLVDQQQHMTLNKIILGSLGVLSFAYFAVGTVVGVVGTVLGDDTKWPGRHWRKIHTDMMFRGWIWSISGAGPIRMIVSVMHPLGFGPIRCQEAHGSLASECLWPYLGRLCMIATWNHIMTGAYCKIRQDAFLTKTYLANVVLHVVMCGSFWLMSLYGDESAAFISRLTGAPATDFSWVMTCIGLLAEMMQLTVYFPRQFVAGAFLGPAALVGFLVSQYYF